MAGRVLLVVLAALVLTSSAAMAATSVTPKTPATRICKKTRAACPSTTTTATTTTTTQTTTSAAKSTTTAKAATKPAASVDKTTLYDGTYAGTYKLVATVTGVQGGDPAPIDTTAPVHFTVLHGIVSWDGHNQLSNGQTSVVVPFGTGTYGGTIYFVLGANDAVTVHGALHGQLSEDGGSVILDGTLSASRISR